MLKNDLALNNIAYLSAGVYHSQVLRLPNLIPFIQHFYFLQFWHLTSIWNLTEITMKQKLLKNFPRLKKTQQQQPPNRDFQ